MYSNGKLLCPTQQTPYKHMTNRYESVFHHSIQNRLKQNLKSIHRWNEWLLFPLKLSDIPRDSLLCFTIVDTCDSAKPCVLGGTAITVFGKHGSIRRGMYDLRVWLNNQKDSDNDIFTNGKYNISQQINRITKVLTNISFTF